MFVVTGACGFIGSMMIKYLNSMGIDRIILIDDLNGMRHPNIKNTSFSYFYPMYWNELILPERIHIDAVFHFGAISDTLEKNANKINMFNVEYTSKLATACTKRNIPLIFSSSAAIYGNGNGPLNLYANSKLESETHISSSSVCMRLFNVYGPNEYHKNRMASVIYKWFNELKSTGTISIFENSNLYNRDFIYVKDVCKVAYKFFEEYTPGIYDVGTGNNENFDYVADCVIQNFGSGTKTIIPIPEDLRQQYQTNTKATNLKYPNDLLNVEKGIIEYFKYLKDGKYG